MKTKGFNTGEDFVLSTEKDMEEADANMKATWSYWGKSLVICGLEKGTVMAWGLCGFLRAV